MSVLSIRSKSKNDLHSFRVFYHDPLVGFVEAEALEAHFFVEFDCFKVVFVDVESDPGDGGISVRQSDDVPHESRGDAPPAEV